MPFRDEEMNRRREKREAQRKRRQAQARRLRLTAFAAVLVLAACAGLIWYLTRDNREEEAQLQSAVEQTTAPTETKAPDPRIQKDPITTIHIRAAGDLNITDSVISSGFRMGRSLAAAHIQAGKAAVDGLPCEKPDKLIVEGQKVSLRGFGKLKLASIGGKTKKDRISVVIHRYV